MANLKELRNKIGVIQSTRKVTAAMKLVAGVKLRKAERKVSESREYAIELNRILARLRREFLDAVPELFAGRKNVAAVLLVVFSSDRGLCGNFNYLIQKFVTEAVLGIRNVGASVHLVCVGKRLFDYCKNSSIGSDSLELVADFYNVDNIYENSKLLAEKIVKRFNDRKVDNVSVIFTKYLSAMKQMIEMRSLIPLESEINHDETVTVFEPNVGEILQQLLPQNIAVQIYQSALESIASEQSIRMKSMDNATRNADEMLYNFKIKYNRLRQNKITQELVEVISGAEAIVEG
ncbi:MAG: ATP synthase F1 subunit gamma [Holosporaceae bacterium]|jgi:F-type H+-transporting ATPase subunit gamma|nr:ATP synthase F1 subunit gamma [Holosporaceae bacterium]